MKQDELEKAVIKAFLSYGDEVSNLLLKQVNHLKMKDRTFTGLGFFTHFTVPEEFQVGAVETRYAELGAFFKKTHDHLGFILYVHNGCIFCLEAFTTAIEWERNNMQDLDMTSMYGGGKSSFA